MRTKIIPRVALKRSRVRTRKDMHEADDGAENQHPQLCGHRFQVYILNTPNFVSGT
jgi:hypothetical protein